jgi:hypothetical protein
MKVILIREKKGGDKAITLIDAEAIELSKEMEEPDKIGFIPRPIISTTLTVDVKSMQTIKLTRKRNVMKYIRELFRSK